MHLDPVHILIPPTNSENLQLKISVHNKFHPVAVIHKSHPDCELVNSESSKDQKLTQVRISCCGVSGTPIRLLEVHNQSVASVPSRS